MDPSYEYETRTKDGVAASTLGPTVPFVRTRDSGETVRPFMATNRSTTTKSLIQDSFNEQLDSDIMRALEGVPKTTRGARNKPSVMRYPEEIGSGEVPHVMQFKVFWRWESKDMVEKLENAKMEAEKTLTGLNTLASRISQGILDRQNIEQGDLSDEQISALKEITNSINVVKTVDPSFNDNLATMLTLNPKKSKLILEETIKSYQARLTDINAEISDETGRVGLDQQERLLVENRLGESVQQVGVGSSIITGAIGGFVTGLAVGGLKGGAVGAVIGGVGAPVAAGLAKAYQNQAVYDQMVSIYLPYCTKINNEDAFQYEESSQAGAGGFFDALGSPGESFLQGAELGIQKLIDATGAKDAAAIARGKVLNPRLEKLFKQKQFRQFNFSWEFYPKTKKEVDMVREIIEAFRYHSHPAADDQSKSNEQKVQIMLRVPAEFEIRFLSTNPGGGSGFVENEYIPKIGRCALTSIGVDYTPNSIYSSFVDNSPTAITVTMQFSEMGLLTREAIDKGY
jgi:hypothetical protein